MSTVETSLTVAQTVLEEVIRRRGLRVGLNSSDQGWIEILLLDESRSLWLGHLEGAGFFVTWDREFEPRTFFEFNDAGLQSLLDILPPSLLPEAEVNNRTGEVLLESLASPSPDVDLLEEVIEAAPSTPEGLNVLAMLFSLKSYRLAADRLRHLLATQHEKDHTEAVYQDLLADYPWMLGAQYTNVLRKECAIWFGSRVDLLLTNVLGYIDIVEVKRPDVDLFIEDKSHKTWHQGQELSKAISQAKKYRRALEEQRFEIARELGLPEQAASRMFRSSVIVVIGRTPPEPKAIEALKEVNSDHGRILVLTYDDVLAIAEATLGIFEKGLHSPQVLLA